MKFAILGQDNATFSGDRMNRFICTSSNKTLMYFVVVFYCRSNFQYCGRILNRWEYAY